MPLKIKICGLTREEDVDRAVALGAAFAGFVLHDKSPRFADFPLLERLLARLARRVPAVGVFVNPAPEFLRKAMALGLDIAQLHGAEPPEFFSGLPFPVWKAFRLRSGAEVAAAAASPADRVLVDADCGPLYGGSGQAADGGLAARLAARRPVVLAGGLNAGNLRAAAAAVRPWALDVSSGVESAPGVKSSEKLEALFAAARGL
ncbi:MAG: phosphoribosylanthranilate isomerase [Opitutaceae bacterium]|jgi:phosphoribosylanthranilate isomerase|nr:phosphoribosylanthranilate isomerase [Opitutaceae bacterium]